LVLVVRDLVAFGLVEGGLLFAITARLAVGLEATASAGFSGVTSLAGVATVATPIVLESVRWQVSQVTTVRTNVPS
jgi:hypothetical protein